MQFQIDNMTCGGCARSVTRAIHSVDPQAKVDIDLLQKRVSVESSAAESAVATVLEDVGYPPVAQRDSARCNRATWPGKTSSPDVGPGCWFPDNVAQEA